MEVVAGTFVHLPISYKTFAVRGHFIEVVSSLKFFFGKDTIPNTHLADVTGEVTVVVPRPAYIKLRTVPVHGRTIAAVLCLTFLHTVDEEGTLTIGGIVRKGDELPFLLLNFPLRVGYVLAVSKLQLVGCYASVTEAKKRFSFDTK